MSLHVIRNHRRGARLAAQPAGHPAFTFYLGTHQPAWLRQLNLPLFISNRRLYGYRTLPVARHPWALDSGAFSELTQYGRWTLAPRAYIAAVRRYAVQIRKLAWAAPQDWMCEPFILAKTGLSVEEHQRRTVANFCALRKLAPDLPFIPVLQGWTIKDYLRCMQIYRATGTDLSREPLVGLGSVCRRQATDEIASIVIALANLGLRLHGFGVKTAGLQRYGPTSLAPTAWRGAFGAVTSPVVPTVRPASYVGQGPKQTVKPSPWNGANAC